MGMHATLNFQSCKVDGLKSIRFQSKSTTRKEAPRRREALWSADAGVVLRLHMLVSRLSLHSLMSVSSLF